MSKGEYYFLSVAAMVTLVCVALMLLRSCLKYSSKLLGNLQLVWWLTRTEIYDEFRVWTLEVCKEPWQQETLLCEAARGSWLARELVRAKLATLTLTLTLTVTLTLTLTRTRCAPSSPPATPTTATRRTPRARAAATSPA